MSVMSYHVTYTAVQLKVFSVKSAADFLLENLICAAANFFPRDEALH